MAKKKTSTRRHVLPADLPPMPRGSEIPKREPTKPEAKPEPEAKQKTTLYHYAVWYPAQHNKRTFREEDNPIQIDISGPGGVPSYHFVPLDGGPIGPEPEHMRPEVRQFRARRRRFIRLQAEKAQRQERMTLSEIAYQQGKPLGGDEV